MVKDSGYKLYAVNITADGTVPLGCQSAFWMPCLKDGRIIARLSADDLIEGNN